MKQTRKGSQHYRSQNLEKEQQVFPFVIFVLINHGFLFFFSANESLDINTSCRIKTNQLKTPVILPAIKMGTKIKVK